MQLSAAEIRPKVAAVFCDYHMATFKLVFASEEWACIWNDNGYGMIS